MRSLYWLTAITLVAAAVTTVAIADYSRRHPGSFFWSETTAKNQPIQYVAADAPSAACQLAPPLPCSSEPTVASLPQATPVPACPACENAPVPIVSANAPAIPTYDEPPEHKQLREQTMSRLTMMQERKPILPPIPQTAPITPDEFTFPGSNPSAPPAQAAPAPVTSDFAAVPTLSPAQTPARLPEVTEFQAEGPEVLPGLRPARPVKPAQDDFANPISDCLQAATELVTLMAVPVHLTALPPRQQTTSANDKKDVLPSLEVAQAPATPSPSLVVANCPETKSCCKDCKAGDEVVVRTYSVEEFAQEKGSTPDDLIRLISTMVEPDSWMTRDSKIEYFPLGKCLVVRHRASVHEQIDDLVNQLRAAVQKQHGATLSVRFTMPGPVVHHGKTDCIPVQFEFVPIAPQESPFRVPRVFTDEPPQCFDDEFFGLAPMRMNGRLMPIPASPAGVIDSSLLPAGFEPMPDSRPGVFDEGPASKAGEKKPPAFFPLYLPFSPLPPGSETNQPDQKPASNKGKD